METIMVNIKVFNMEEGWRLPNGKFEGTIADLVWNPPNRFKVTLDNVTEDKLFEIKVLIETQDF
tara:strand:+ start:793 stop:984 length:192 start_codon:yes stop_codon:yes gene_type:complete